MTSEHRLELTSPSVQKTVEDALGLPEGLSPCYRICEGSEHNVWCVGDSTVLRGLLATCRQSGKAEASLARDADISKLLQRYLRSPEVIPEVNATIKIDSWICNLEKQIRGKSLDMAQPTAGTEKDLIQFFDGFSFRSNRRGYASSGPRGGQAKHETSSTQSDPSLERLDTLRLRFGSGWRIAYPSDVEIETTQHVRGRQLPTSASPQRYQRRTHPH